MRYTVHLDIPMVKNEDINVDGMVINTQYIQNG
jgi:hypothetical protein